MALASLTCRYVHPSPTGFASVHLDIVPSAMLWTELKQQSSVHMKHSVSKGMWILNAMVEMCNDIEKNKLLTA